MYCHPANLAAECGIAGQYESKLVSIVSKSHAAVQTIYFSTCEPTVDLMEELKPQDRPTESFARAEHLFQISHIQMGSQPFAGALVGDR